MNKEYPIATGEIDRHRLEILHSLYAPVTQQFLIACGLKSGMTILEFGCGMGDMSCWFAQYTGESGKVIAIDNSQESLAIAKNKAIAKNIKNIEFLCMDVYDIESLNQKFDFIYGKWVLMHLFAPQDVLVKLYNVLNQNGILAYEDIDKLGQGYFSYPEQLVIENLFTVGTPFYLQRSQRPAGQTRLGPGLDNMKHSFLRSSGIETGIKLFFDFKKLGLHNLSLQVNQPILITKEQKSVIRLGAQVARESIYSSFSAIEFNEIINELIKMENNNSIVGYNRNIIASGRR